MATLIVRFLVDLRDNELLHEVSSKRYSPEILNELVLKCVQEGQKKAVQKKYLLQEMQPQISILLKADDSENLRPALHLTKESVLCIASVGASVDFDPYV